MILNQVIFHRMFWTIDKCVAMLCNEWPMASAFIFHRNFFASLDWDAFISVCLVDMVLNVMLSAISHLKKEETHAFVLCQDRIISFPCKYFTELFLNDSIYQNNKRCKITTEEQKIELKKKKKYYLWFHWNLWIMYRKDTVYLEFSKKN